MSNNGLGNAGDKAMETNLDRLPCAHCSQTGTCTNGSEGQSCAVCVRHKSPFWRIFGAKVSNASIGIICSVCDGIGSVEPFSVRLHKRIVPLLALFIVYIALFLILRLATEDDFDQILAFAGTLIGSITGYYFGGKRTSE